MLLTLTLSIALADSWTPTKDELREQCKTDEHACDRLKQWEANERYTDEYERKQKAEADERVAEMKKRCGKFAYRIRVGDSWALVKKCGLEDPQDWWFVAEDRRGTVYEYPDGFVRIENGVIVKWIIKD